MNSVYDEYISGYKDRSAIVDAKNSAKLVAMGNALNHVIIVDGRIVGAWKRTFSKCAIDIETTLFRSLSKTERRALASASEKYGEFFGLPVNRKVSHETCVLG